ncbi:hypothetical protein D3C85_1480320 [compost metagenome]
MGATIIQTEILAQLQLTGKGTFAMNKYRALLLNDTRQIMTDPMLMASLFGPLLLLVMARFCFPLLSGWLERHYQFDLSMYTDFSAAFLLIIIPLLPGSMAGLLMLDERDENMIAYYAVTLNCGP